MITILGVPKTLEGYGSLRKLLLKISKLSHCKIPIKKITEDVSFKDVSSFEVFPKKGYENGICVEIFIMRLLQNGFSVKRSV